MNTSGKLTVAAVISLLVSGVAAGQAAPPPAATGSTDTSPAAASTPAQRAASSQKTGDALVNEGADPASASGSDQQQATHMAMQGKVDPASFVSKAAQDGITEVELGKLAVSKSSNADVKKFAQRMVTDHSKANNELASLAKRKNLEVPSKLDAKHEAMVKAMSSKSGTAFDAAYAKDMASDHSQAIALFESASKMNDPDLADFASRTLPTLQEHKQMADSLHSSTRTAAAGSAGTQE